MSEILKPSRVVSSAVVDGLAQQVLHYDDIGHIEIPERINPESAYDRGLVENYRADDVAFVRRAMVQFNMSTDELFALDSILRWNFRNSGTLVRSAYGLIAVALQSILPTGYQDLSITAANPAVDLTRSLVGESMLAIRRIVRMTVATGAHECKIPRNQLSEEYNQLIHISKNQWTPEAEVESEHILRTLHSITSSTPIDQTQEKMKVARELALQMVTAISEYRQDDTFGRLRGFLNNVCHFANIVRIMSNGVNVELNRLAADLLDQTHSTDRLLNSNCISALDLVKRMRDGEVVYDRILELGKHQHRVMALEVASCIGLFSYLVKSSADMVRNNHDVRKTLQRLMHFSGIATRYSSEITNKQAGRQA